LNLDNQAKLVLAQSSEIVPKFVADSSVSPTGLKWAVDPVADVVTTAGDLLYATAADTVTRLGIGTAGQVLKVNSGATAPEWGAAGGASGLTLVTSGTFSSVSSVDVSDCFSATYTNYRIVLLLSASSNNAAIDMRLRVSGTNNTDSNYDSQNVNTIDTSVVGASYINANRWQEAMSALSSSYFFSGDIFIANPFATDYTGGSLICSNFSSSGRRVHTTSFAKEVTTSFTGIAFIASAGTISGSYKVYGLAD
jgi:hypothetical protein